MKSSPFKTLGAVLVLSALVGLVIAGFVSILSVRLETGEIYAHYSTQRTDPLGGRALYESFEKLEGRTVTRNLRALSALKELSADDALFLLGVSRSDLEDARVADLKGALDSVSEHGARLVMVTNPQFVFRQETEEDSWLDRREALKEEQEENREKLRKGANEKTSESEDGDESEGDEKPIGELEEGEEERPKMRRLLNRLGVRLVQPASYEIPEGGWRTDSTVILETPPRWQSPVYFEYRDEDSEWTTILTVEHDGKARPVAIERPWGEHGGTIAMTSDAYFASNEALWKSPSDGTLSLLLWLAGDRPNLVFDETIHSFVEGGGIMKLIKKHRLHGFFLGLFIFVALLAWKSGTSLVPGNEQIERGLRSDGRAVTGEAASSGLVRLLKRSIPAKQLLSQCVLTWRETAKRVTPEQQKAIDSAVAAAESDPKNQLLPAYRSIVDALRRK